MTIENKCFTDITSNFEFTNLTQMPGIGLAGPFSGISNNTILVAGGSNFPFGAPWDGHPKIWHDSIYALEGNKWIELDIKLPHRTAYGVSLSHKDTMVCIGGGNDETHHSDAYTITYKDGNAIINNLPSLSQKTSFMSGAILNDIIYIAGGIEKPDSVYALSFFQALDLNNITDGWKVLDQCPGDGRILSGCVAQGEKMYIYGGASLSENENGRPKRHYLNDAFCYDPITSSWTQIASLPYPLAAAPTPAMTVNQTHFLIFGGDNSKGATYGSEETGLSFNRNILSYNLESDKWKILGETPKQFIASVTTNAVQNGSKYIVAAGEARPGIRTPQIYQVETA